MNENATYVYENTEVVLTGRVGSRKLPSGKVDVLHEITPAASIAGVWKKWVRMMDLYVIDNGDHQ